MDNPSVASDQSQKKSPFDELSREELASKCKGLLALAQKAKQAKSDLQNELESYKLKLEQCESEKKASAENIQTLQELVDSLTEQKLNFITEKLSDLDSEIISLKRQNKRLLDENEQLLNQLTDIEAKTTEFNNIGLQQQEQLKILEENVQKDKDYNKIIEELNSKVSELEAQLQKEQENKSTYEMKIKDITEMYETEKVKKEKANIKLRSYKDKILKCAACINQLKNSRFILSKTVKEYSENIPKWQNDLIKASKVLDEQLSKVNTENSSLKERLQLADEQINQLTETLKYSENTKNKISELSSTNNLLQLEIIKLKEQLDKAIQDNSKVNKELSIVYDESKDSARKIADLSEKNRKYQKEIDKLKIENNDLSDSLKRETHNNESNTNLLLQIKALESEKSILVKEKLNARDSVLDLENKNKVLVDQVTSLTTEIQTINSQLQRITQEKLVLEKNHKADKEGEVNMLKCEIRSLQEQCDRFKKEYDDLQDLNGILREEVETLKLSLEQPKDECDNLSDLNASLQADVVKLETKLAAYKQENSSLLSEVKESRNKIKEYDSLLLEYENVKSNLLSYKTENSELLNEMKEINQVLKERGEAISKLQKAIAEMELLVETLEKDRDNVIQDKSDLQKKIDSLENTLKNAEQKTQESNDYTNQLIAERDNAMKALDSKEDYIASLKTEMDKLKQQNSTPTEIPMEDNMSTSTISKAEEYARMKDLDETFEEKYSKLRIFALKLKKKLNETVTQMQNSEQDKARLEKLLNEKAILESKLDAPLNQDVIDGTDRDEHSGKDLQEKIEKLTVALEAAKQDCSELEKVKAELTSKSQQLASEMESHKVTKDNLEKARRDVKKKNVLSLEMEDYERSMKELTSKMEENKKKMVQMESIIDTQEATIIAMKTQIKLLEEQIKTEETQCRHLKEELQHALEEIKEKDNIISVKNGIISKLEQDLEDEKRKNEESDMELTAVLSDKEKVIMSLAEEKAELNNKVKRMEFKCAELKENIQILNIELADLKTEYTSYKVRAQAVLRQNQMVDHSQEEQLKEEMAALKAQIETLTLKLATAQEQLAEQRSETENGRRRAAEASNEATRAQQRTARLHTDLTRLSQQLESERAQHKLQISTLTQCYKTQINELETKLQKETENLKKQLMVVQNENTTVSALGMSQEPHNSHYMLPVIPKDENSDGEMDINVSMIPREEGEGSESAPSPPPSKSYMTAAGSSRSPVPLERLLEEGVPDDEALDTASLALTPEQEISDLKRKLLAQQQRVKHVTVLLSESERECARRWQLSELLKAELRRARGADHSAHNAEYMKNVTLKFLTLPPGDERGRLVPVLQKILTLTQEETQKIQAIAKGMDPNPGKGWGSYLPWPGSK
ncbi:hypothetical protein O3G_MSEX007725 [Manduca sexta]|uniref:GRIP domain-containing protein n=1 Tax=Manduca sexta TaxID=7130 RepID=A0A921Z8V2_MANSE|nr:hypothetical protein O3G_MSEX007725 [Manduca sexta]